MSDWELLCEFVFIGNVASKQLNKNHRVFWFSIFKEQKPIKAIRIDLYDNKIFEITAKNQKIFLEKLPKYQQRIIKYILRNNKHQFIKEVTK